MQTRHHIIVIISTTLSHLFLKELLILVCYIPDQVIFQLSNSTFLSVLKNKITEFDVPMMVPGWKSSVCLRIVWPERPSRICNNKSSIYDNSKLKGTKSQHSLVSQTMFLDIWAVAANRQFRRLPTWAVMVGGGGGVRVLEVVHIGHTFIRKTARYRMKFCNFWKWTIPLFKTITLRHCLMKFVQFNCFNLKKPDLSERFIFLLQIIYQLGFFTRFTGK